MRRHELDWASLLAGLVVLGVAATWFVGRYTDVDLDPAWVLPGILIGLGGAGLVASVTRLGHDAVGGPADDLADLREVEEP